MRSSLTNFTRNGLSVVPLQSCRMPSRDYRNQGWKLVQEMEHCPQGQTCNPGENHRSVIHHAAISSDVIPASLPVGFMPRGVVVRFHSPAYPKTRFSNSISPALISLILSCMRVAKR